MSDIPKLPEPQIAPLARAYRLGELPGRVTKWLEVPAGRTGLRIDSSGGVRRYQPGRQQVLSTWERVRGLGAGLLVGYFPARAFPSLLKGEYILSGDGELLDASLSLSVVVSDAVRFFSEQVVQRGEIPAQGLEISDAAAQTLFASIARQYAHEDLIQTALGSRLEGEISYHLSQALESQGLSIEGVQLVSFRRADERAVIAEKVQALNERLQDVELGAKMAQVESHVQLNEFIQQFDPELVSGLNLKQLVAGRPESQIEGEEAQRASLGEQFRAWLNLETSKEAGRRRWRLEGLLHRPEKEEGAPPKTKIRRPPQYWWLPRTLWMVFVTLAGLGLTRLVAWIAEAASWDSKLEITLAIWGFVIVAILESVKALYEKREALSEVAFPLHGITYIDDLVSNDRQRADRLVRAQVGEELQHIREVLNDVRGRVYKGGDTDLALTIRELERKTDLRSSEMQRPDFGQPPYLRDLKVSRRAWNTMLDYDEDLLMFANALSDKAHLLQQKYGTEELNPEMVLDLEKDLDQLHHTFAGRSRAIKMPLE